MEAILKEMERVYGMFCMPVAFVDTHTGDVTFSNVWDNQVAEEYYNKLSELYRIAQHDAERHAQAVEAH